MSKRAQQMTGNTARRSVPGFFLAVGGACLVAATVGGHLALGLVTFGILVACSLALVLLGRRSETYKGLTEVPDERFARIGGLARSFAHDEFG
jgi:membrane protein implicated in regulation of membrane protease activity